MIDPAAITKLVEQQVSTIVNEQVMSVFADDKWLKPIEDKIIQFTQDRILGKFNNSSALPEIVDAVKTSVDQLFKNGQVPGIDQYVDKVTVKQTIDIAVEELVSNSIAALAQDQAWLYKIETLANQTMVQHTIAGLNSLDLKTVIREHVDSKMSDIHKKLLSEFSSTGISDQATQCQLTVMDDNTVVENKLVTKDLSVVSGATIRNLAVTGSINVDNPAWDDLSETVSQRTLGKLTDDWYQTLVDDVTTEVKANGIDFSQVTIDGVKLIDGNKLNSAITDTNIQTLGILKQLRVKGEADINDTLTVVNKRIGVNTQEPEMALSVWDEEVSIIAGKVKNKTAYVGTSRDQSLTLGVNRQPYIEIDNTGLTAIKKLQVGVHKIGHGTEVPNYAGTKGDIVFNANANINDTVFAWVCLGAYKWKVLRAAE